MGQKVEKKTNRWIDWNRKKMKSELLQAINMRSTRVKHEQFLVEQKKDSNKEIHTMIHALIVILAFSFGLGCS